MGQSWRRLRRVPLPVLCLLVLEVVKSGLFRDPAVQNVELDLDGRAIAEAVVILLAFASVLSRAGALRRAFAALPAYPRLALALYALCVLVSIPVSLNPPLSALRAVEVFDYLAAALIWSAALRQEDTGERFIDRVRGAAAWLCALAIACQVIAAGVHPGQVEFAEMLKSNSYSVPCALLLALSVERFGARFNRGTAIAALGLVLFQSLSSVLAGLTGIAWLVLERFVLRHHRLPQSSRLALLGAGLAVAGLLFPVALAGVEGVGRLMGRDTGSVTSLTGRAELWSNLVGQIAADPGRFALGLGVGVGERVYVQTFSEANKRDLAAVGVVDVALHRHSHNTVLAAVINIGFLGAVATLLLYVGTLLVPPAAAVRDGRALFVCVLVLAINGVSTNLFATADVTTLLVMLLACTPRRPLAAQPAPRPGTGQIIWKAPVRL